MNIHDFQLSSLLGETTSLETRLVTRVNRLQFESDPRIGYLSR